MEGSRNLACFIFFNGVKVLKLMPDLRQNDEEETIEELAANNNWTMDCSAVTGGVTVKTLHITSSISESESESEQRHVTLRINASEEAGLTQLLKFKYATLTHAAKQYLAGRFKDITKFEEEVMSMPLSAIEAILASDDLQVASEIEVYDFVLKWARQHYNNPKERREVLGARLARVIRFPFMTCDQLKKVLHCSDIMHGASSFVIVGLCTRAQESLKAFPFPVHVERKAYMYRPVKVVEFELPQQQCVVYLDLKREECASLFPSGNVKSQIFHLGEHVFSLLGVCRMNKQCSFHYFEIVVGMGRKEFSGSLVVDCEFAARSRPAEEKFVRKHKSCYTFTRGTLVGCGNLFEVPWTEFIAEDSPFFINNVLHLRAELTIRK